MLRVGITGPIGCGKSFISARLEDRGYFVYDADSHAKRLVEEDAALRTGIVRLLGGGAFLSDGRYNRKWVAEQVFTDSRKLKGLNRLIHPVVIDDFRRTIESHGADSMVFFESALLPQIAWCDILDRILVVTAPVQVREVRVMQRDGVAYDAVHARMASQADEETYLNLADVVLSNDGMADLDEGLNRALKQLRVK